MRKKEQMKKEEKTTLKDSEKKRRKISVDVVENSLGFICAKVHFVKTSLVILSCLLEYLNLSLLLLEDNN